MTSYHCSRLLINRMLTFLTFILLIRTCKSSIEGNVYTDDRHNVDPNARNSSNPPNVPLFTFRPTRRPTRRPSTRPSKQPISKPTRKPSSRPTRRPSLNPTSLPTIHPSGKPTYFPTIRPTAVPTNTRAPSINNCETTTGSIGEKTVNEITIVYNYQMELRKNATPSDVLPYLEVAVTNALIKNLYSKCNRRVLQHLSSQPRHIVSTIQLAGISSFPPDVDMSIIQGQCSSGSSGNSCFPIKGGATLYFSFSNRRLETNILSTMAASVAINSSMNDGSLSAVHPAIVGLKYLNDGSTSPDIVPPAQVVKAERSYPLMIAFITVGATLFLIFLLLSTRYLSNKRKISRKLFYQMSDDGLKSSLTTHKGGKLYGPFDFSSISRESDLDRTPIRSSMESKERSMDFSPVSNTLDNAKSISSPKYWEKYNASFDFSPISNSLLDKKGTDGYDLSSESVVVKIERRLPEYDRVWRKFW